jgi:hypothetical protein
MNAPTTETHQMHDEETTVPTTREENAVMDAMLQAGKLDDRYAMYLEMMNVPVEDILTYDEWLNK